ncbi:hypothetical protein ACFYT3_18080 [Nocardia amikacinitolerans]|uniref:hypothetical protein n=1 Tax=Nocardia amikacinitolerans TaxID=756689 RepID=UPI0036A3335D
MAYAQVSSDKNPSDGPLDVDDPAGPAQKHCSAAEISSGPWSIRNIFGGLPPAVDTFSSSATSLSPVIERSPRCSSNSRVCSSNIDATFTARPSTVASNGKPKTQHLRRIDLNARHGRDPASLRGECFRTCTPSSRQSRWIFMFTGLPSSNRNAAYAGYGRGDRGIDRRYPCPVEALTAPLADRKKLVRAIVDTVI